MLRAKVLCTIGPASWEPEVLRQLMAEGMDVARINFSHGDLDTHARTITRVRETAAQVGKPVAILGDLQGPKLRMGEMIPEGVLLREGQEVRLTTESLIGRAPDALPVQNQDLPRLLQPGEQVLIDDGLLELKVLSITDTEIRCRVLVGGVLKSNKGINLPHASLDLPSLTEKDRRDLAFALNHQVDWLALSFVRTADEVLALKQLIRSWGHSDDAVPVMAKIEKPEALDNLDPIIAASDAIMVARGDLGIEILTEQVPIMQKEIIEKCNRAGVPVVTATQMLDSMIRNPRPTRAEASDVANAVLDGTDAVMLSGETSVGSYPVHAVRTMVRIVQRVEGTHSRAFICPFQSAVESTHTIADAVTHAARETAHDLGAAAIITPTVSGYTAQLMSHHRPACPVIAVTPNPVVQRRLMLYWGVTPLLAPRTGSTDGMIAQAVQAALNRGLVKAGDKVVITAGAAGSAPGTTNLIKVQQVG